jgi:hypothetical protein
MIVDPERLVDGFRGMLGMDGSRDPSQINVKAASYAVNCTFRGGGGPRTRPGFKEIPYNYWRNPTNTSDAEYYLDLAHEGSTSRSRFQTYIRGGKFFQGALVYNDPRQGNPTQIILVVDGWIMSLNFAESSCFLLNPGQRLANNLKCYLCQAERFLIIQDGVSHPLVFDGYSIRRADSFGSPCVPTGKQMAYGHGRLFVAVNDGTEIVAGDIIYGGSTESLEITTSSVDFPTTLTTPEDHGFQPGDLVTISGHSSVPRIDGTYYISATPASNKLTIPAAVASPGLGGFVYKFNGGSDEDLLLTNETTYLAEGGSFSLPGEMGRVKTLQFIPVQDDTTGQGDLIAFCERGAASYQVNLNRVDWKNTRGFQRVMFLGIGSAAESAVAINGDIFFRSLEGNGIRTYRSARAEFDSYGQTPLSAEIDPVLNQDTDWMLENVSFLYFDDRLLMTCHPKGVVTAQPNSALEEEAAKTPIPITYSGIAVLDFRSVSSIDGKAAAAYDGLWEGLNILSLVGGQIDGVHRAFAVVLNNGFHEFWEISSNDEFDSFNSVSDAGVRPIVASITTKHFNFDSEMSQKKLIRGDAWFDDLGGGPSQEFSAKVWYRPDNHPNWVYWTDFSKCFITEQTIAAGGSLQTLSRGYSPQIRFPTPGLQKNPSTDLPLYLGYEFGIKIEWRGRARLNKFLLHALKQIESVGGAI